ncbi:MAG: nucleotide exchange factor GrpE [Thermoleophilia bacterium]
MTQDKKSPAHEKKQHGPEELREQGKDPSGRKLAEISTDLHEEVLRERDEYLESLQRLQAEFANFRKRVLRDSEQQTKQASSKVIEELLPVLDNFERAMRAAAQHDEKLLTDGVELVYNQLRDILTRRGLCEIEAEGAAFDPAQHEAVLCQPSGKHEEGTVIQVLEKGYQLEDKVVRPAKVIVSTHPGEDDSHGQAGGPKSS